MPAYFINLAVQPDSVLIEKGILKPYQQNRILSFLYPDEYEDKEAYQQLNSVTAIGSGQLDGKGYKTNEISSVKTETTFWSPRQTLSLRSSVKSSVSREAAPWSSCFCLLHWNVFLWRQRQRFVGSHNCGRYGRPDYFQSFINLGVVTFILPNTGLTLPFISYGLTSLVSLYMGMGFVLNVRLQCKRG